MDRGEFIDSLNCGNYFNSHFDEFMTFYDVINCYNEINIENYNIIDTDKILFNISIPSDKSPFDIKRILDSTIMNKYKSIFRIQTNIVDNDKLNIILYKVGVSR